MTETGKEIAWMALCLVAFLMGLHQVHQERGDSYQPLAEIQSSVEAAAKKFDEER
ncbi:hypothetical protein IFT43_05695 [Oxalobacteraceae sp. CFBP 13708]|nr:hypothetical protein [Oxalobacteraceae sp. CFBP 13708]